MSSLLILYKAQFVLKKNIYENVKVYEHCGIAAFSCALGANYIQKNSPKKSDVTLLSAKKIFTDSRGNRQANWNFVNFFYVRHSL